MTFDVQPQPATAPFVVREEHFGCLVYNRAACDYIAFDHEAFEIFKGLSQGLTPNQVYERLAGTASRTNFDTFLRLCASIELLDGDRFTGAFLHNRRPEQSRALSAPTHLDLQLTRYCNYACRHCWADAGRPRDRELDILTVKTLFDQMAQMGVFVVNLVGGEPLGRRDLVEVVEYANSVGISVNIHTNAALAVRNLAQRLGAVKVNSFCVSFDAGSEKNYDYVRGVTSFRKALRGIEHLKSACPDTELYFKVALQKDNRNEIPGIVRQAKSCGVKRIVFSLALPVGRGKANSSVLLSGDEALRVLQLAREIGTQTSGEVDIEVLDEVPPTSLAPRAFEGFGCECGQLHCFVSSSGVVAPSGLVCDSLPCGSIRKDKLYDIWNTAAPFGLFRNNRGNAACNVCEHFRYCRGGCRSRTYVMTGDMSKPDPLCTLKPVVKK